MSTETDIINSEANDRAVIISEEIEFMEHLLTAELPSDVVTDIVERRDELRDSIRSTVQPAPPDGVAEEGFAVPDGVDMKSEAYGTEDEVKTLPEDEDHEYVSNRNDKQCLVCGQSKEACTEEP